MRKMHIDTIKGRQSKEVEMYYQQNLKTGEVDWKGCAERQNEEIVGLLFIIQTYRNALKEIKKENEYRDDGAIVPWNLEIHKIIQSALGIRK